MYEVSISNPCWDWTLSSVSAHLRPGETAPQCFDNHVKFFPICFSSSVNLSSTFPAQGFFLIHSLYVSWIVNTFSFVCVVFSPISGNCSVADGVSRWTPSSELHTKWSREAAGAGALRTRPLTCQWWSSSTSPPWSLASLTANWGDPPPLSSRNFTESSKFSTSMILRFNFHGTEPT